MTERDSAEEYVNGYMWAGFIRFAFDEPGYREAFTAETGIAIVDAPRSQLEAMIDEAAGVDRDAALAAFVRWATVNHYGLEHAPKAYRDSIKEAP